MGLIILQPTCCADLSAAVPILESTKGVILCPSCKKPIGTLISNPGYVYVLSSGAFPGTFKVGFTNRAVYERVEELNSSTSLPSPFKVEMYFLSKSAKDEEIISHADLSSFRMNERREFFKLPLVELHDKLCRALKRSPNFISLDLAQLLATRTKSNIIYTNVMQRVNKEIAKKLGGK